MQTRLSQTFLALALISSTLPALAESTQVDVRVLARGAKFIGGYSDSARVVLSDAETGEVLARGLTQGTTGDTSRILGGGVNGDKRLSTPDAAVFRATLDLAQPRRVTATVTGPLSQPQAATTVTSTQWLLPGRHVTQGDGWVLELPGLVVDLVEPAAFQPVNRGTKVPLQVSVTMMCGCALSEAGPWKAGTTDVDYQITVNGKVQRLQRMSFDPKTGRYSDAFVPDKPGIHEIEVRAWDAPNGNAGVARTTVFVR
ncbi:hypothetical protein [Stenotrophomonas sp. 278]|uniref:hypothetical protein n=1 Tax=Stenotrophomonas sp. 278 TaxID=2479851 RepID=UPI000F67A59A|nr:hypothetical protein [Stenotrophomonas sp. 278]RRU25602.1 hypothetical protein EGJ34_00610 [Stenotrophomonas sp. 278]